MSGALSWVAATILILAFTFVLLGFVGRRPEHSRLTPLAGLAWGLFVAGFVFNEDRSVAYSLFAIGAILAVLDILRRRKSDWRFRKNS